MALNSSGVSDSSWSRPGAAMRALGCTLVAILIHQGLSSTMLKAILGYQDGLSGPSWAILHARRPRGPSIQIHSRSRRFVVAPSHTYPLTLAARGEQAVPPQGRGPEIEPQGTQGGAGGGRPRSRGCPSGWPSGAASAARPREAKASTAAATPGAVLESGVAPLPGEETRRVR